MPDKISFSSQAFLLQVIDERPYTIECVYSDNGKEYKETIPYHPFALTCNVNNITQRFNKIKTSKTNNKAERVIRTIFQMWHNVKQFSSKEKRRINLIRFVNFYNTVKPHSEIANQTPYECLYNYFYPDKVLMLKVNY